MSVGESRSAFGPCANGYNRSIFELKEKFCGSQFTVPTIICICFCMIFFAVGITNIFISMINFFSLLADHKTFNKVLQYHYFGN